MTRDEIKAALKRGCTLRVDASWCFTISGMSCSEGCCYREFSTIDETLEAVADHSSKKDMSDVEICYEPEKPTEGEQQ